MPCGVGFLASSSANVLVEGSSSKTKRDCPRVFEGSNVAKVSGDNTGDCGCCESGDVINGPCISVESEGE